MIVVSDRRLRTKQWRAVYLKGLGAFPIVWSIIFALTRYVDGDMALKHPKRRTINLLEYDFELLIKSIVVAQPCGLKTTGELLRLALLHTLFE